MSSLKRRLGVLERRQRYGAGQVLAIVVNRGQGA